MQDDNEDRELLNAYQKEQLANAKSTMQQNMEGGNIDARGASVARQREGMREVTEPETRLGEAALGKGGGPEGAD